MKKLLFEGLSTGVEFSASNKENSLLSLENVKMLSENISIEQDILVFKDVKSYEYFISHEDVSLIYVALKQLDDFEFKNLRSSLENDFYSNPETEEDDSFEELDGFIDYLLNKDGVISINGYLFKIDISKQTVYSLPFDISKDDYNEALSKIQQLAENVSIFSMEDNIFGTLFFTDEDDNEPILKAKKECSKGTQNTKDWYEYYDNKKSGRKRLRYRCRLRVQYLNLGFYKSLTTTFEHQAKQGNGGIWKDDYNSFSIGYDVSWMNNAGGQSGQVHHNPTNLEYYAKNKQIKFYSGIKCLRIFDLVSHSKFLNKGNPSQVLFFNPDSAHHISQVY